MISCLVDFGDRSCSDPLVVVHGRKIDEIVVEARRHASFIGCDPSEIEIYQILRNPEGDLYLADLFGDAIRSEGRM